ncbi:LemA family protein [Alistipes sp. ZOR0009]|uniref:LemA family protein n=1 Tax=Alistipes sp. ZOR0009 TaxID=1339253 RepID=UPI000645A5EB|nr:LemA family protein [Alistipes sp. ZOR0009]
MKKTWIVLAVIAAVILIIFLWFKNSYNGLVVLDENVKGKWANVESQYQRRADLIPNLVNTVKGYADFEKSTLTQVMEARANATKITISPEKLDENSIQKFQNAQNQVSSALGRLMAVAENYPNLKANQNFLDLQSQLEGTENRITVARNDFNADVKTYNQTIRKFPQMIFASMFGFEKAAYFEADKGAEKAPEVKF